MKPFEFVLVIVSVIVGLALTEFAVGVADMIKSYKTAHFYWAHIVFSGFGFISCLTYWGSVYKLRDVNLWSIASVGIIFTSGLIFFTITRITFPGMEGFDRDYEKYFNENITIILVLLILFVFFLMLESFVIRKIRQPKKYFMGVFFVLVIVSGILVNNNLYRGFLTVILLVLQICHMYTTKIIIYDKSGEENISSKERGL